MYINLAYVFLTQLKVSLRLRVSFNALLQTMSMKRSQGKKTHVKAAKLHIAFVIKSTQDLKLKCIITDIIIKK
uniref:Uncharacterized protein n=1 Tax=Glossina morsitans morsitans TaxID=37546 RepID=A0A1B0G9Z4_GLOMM